MFKLKPVYQYTIVAIISSLNVIVNFFLRIQTPTGFISLVEVGIFLMAWVFGSRMGGITGAITGFLVDLISGYPQWMFFSLIIHGVEGLVIGKLSFQRIQKVAKLSSIIVGGMIMISGYFISSIILQLCNRIFLKTAVAIAITEIWGNFFQILIGSIVALIILPIFKEILRKQSNIFK